MHVIEMLKFMQVSQLQQLQSYTRAPEFSPDTVIFFSYIYYKNLHTVSSRRPYLMLKLLPDLELSTTSK